MLSIDFQGEVALVCGSGAGGIGWATTRLLAEPGAHLVAVDYSEALVNETKSRIEAMGGQCLGITEDLRETIRSQIGHVDLVANIAGGTLQGQWLRLNRAPDETYASVTALDVDHVFRVWRDVAAMMIERGKGDAINIYAVSAFASAPYHGPHGTAKRAVAALTQTMAVEWGRYNIRANSVMPERSVHSARPTLAVTWIHGRNTGRLSNARLRPRGSRQQYCSCSQIWPRPLPARR